MTAEYTKSSESSKKTERVQGEEDSKNNTLLLINEFMDLFILLDHLFIDDSGYNQFFNKTKKILIQVACKKHEEKWCQYSDQIQEFFTFKNSIIFLINQHLNCTGKSQYQSIMQSKESILQMVLVNINNFPENF